jgi:outer membrane lipoprotein carrier protein
MIERAVHLTTVLVMLVLCAANLQADETVEGRQLLEDFVNNVHSMSADFEQSLVDADDVVVETSRGTVSIRRPGQFRWSYVEPYEQVLVADGLNVWSYDVDLEQVTVKAQAEVLANTPALLLGGSREVLDDFELVDTSSDRETEWLRLRPKNPDNGFEQVELGFDAGVLRRMIFTDNLEQTTLIALFEVGLNESLDDELFTFLVPANADLVGEPILADRAGM